MTYTNIAKPVGTAYSNVNATGKQQYDQSDIFYDDSNVFYDGINTLAYTNISKPSFQMSQFTVGYANGLMIPLTKTSVISQIAISPYINISKPS